MSSDHLVIFDIPLRWGSIHLWCLYVYDIYYDVNKFFWKVVEAMSPQASKARNRNSFYKEECNSHYRKFFLFSLITLKFSFVSLWRAGAIHSVHKIHKRGWLVGDWHSESPFLVSPDHSVSFFFWLCWAFFAARGLSLGAASRNYSNCCAGFSLL